MDEYPEPGLLRRFAPRNDERHKPNSVGAFPAFQKEFDTSGKSLAYH
jgi:hypothetical protein